MEYINYIGICTPDPKRFSLERFPADFNREIRYVYIAYLSNWRNLIYSYKVC